MAKVHNPTNRFFAYMKQNGTVLYLFFYTPVPSLASQRFLLLRVLESKIVFTSDVSPRDAMLTRYNATACCTFVCHKPLVHQGGGIQPTPHDRLDILVF